MKNAIIAALGAYIFYSFCVVRAIYIPFMVFIFLWVVVEEIDQTIAEYKHRVKKGKRLSRIIERLKGGQYE